MGSLLRLSQTTYGAKRPWARAALICSATGKARHTAGAAHGALQATCKKETHDLPVLGQDSQQGGHCDNANGAKNLVTHLDNPIMTYLFFKIQISCLSTNDF